MAPQARAAAAWCGWRTRTVTGLAGNSAASARSAASPMIPPPTTRTGSSSGGGCRPSPWSAIEIGSCSIAMRSGTPSGTAWSIEACATTCSAQPPPRPSVKPIDRPGVRTRLSSSRQLDGQPRAQLAQGGSIPRTRQGRIGSTATRAPTGDGAVGAGLDHRPGDLVAEHERQGAERHQGRRPSTGRREQVQIAAADPSAGHRHPRPLPGRQLRFGHLGEGGRKPGVGQIESDGLHAGSLPQPRSPGASCPCGALRRGIDTIERSGGLTPIYLVI